MILNAGCHSLSRDSKGCHVILKAPTRYLTLSRDTFLQHVTEQKKPLHVQVLELEEGWDALALRAPGDVTARSGEGGGGRGFHRFGSALREPVGRDGAADGVVVGVCGVVGLVCGGLVGAVVMVAAGQQLEVEADRRKRPWLYQEARGQAQYQPWHYPPVSHPPASSVARFGCLSLSDSG